MVENEPSYAEAVAKLQLLPVPPHERMADGKWTQTWSLTMESELDEEAMRECAASLEKLGALLSLGDTNILRIRTALPFDTATAEGVARTQQIFARVQGRMGPISLIEGVPQDRWSWFTAEVLKHLERQGSPGA